MPDRITISKIASEAGVSKATVSRVLNSRPGVLPETWDRVMTVIDKYQFQPNIHACSISQHRCRCIGVVFTLDIDYVFRNPFYTEMQRVILKVAKAHGYEVLVICCEELKEAMNAVMEKRVDGLILISPRQDQSSAVQDMVKRGISLVCLGRVREDVPCFQVCTNNYEGAVMAMRHLGELGHRRVGYINGPHFLFSSAERYRAYWDTMEKWKSPITAGLVQEGNNSIESGYTAATAIFEANPDITALFVASDLMAIGALNAIKDRGMSIPEEAAVVGFDNVPISKQFTPSLTTIDQHIHKKAETGMELLLDMIEGRPLPDRYCIEVPPTLVTRGSTGRNRQERGRGRTAR